MKKHLAIAFVQVDIVNGMAKAVQESQKEKPAGVVTDYGDDTYCITRPEPDTTTEIFPKGKPSRNAHLSKWHNINKAMRN